MSVAVEISYCKKIENIYSYNSFFLVSEFLYSLDWQYFWQFSKTVYYSQSPATFFNSDVDTEHSQEKHETSHRKSCLGHLSMICSMYSHTCVQRPPSGPQVCGRSWQVVVVRRRPLEWRANTFRSLLILDVTTQSQSNNKLFSFSFILWKIFLQ
jgi:hypothetical protein